MLPRGCRRTTVIALIFAFSTAHAGPRGWAKTVLADRLTLTPTNAAVRFSLYPKTTSAQSLKATIKRSVSGIGDLGLEVKADDVSSLLTGSQDSVFEAMSGVLSRAAAVPGRPHVSMQCTISTDVPPGFEPPPRSGKEWAPEAPSRVACQFAVYSLCELGTCEDSIFELASRSACFHSERELCTMLDGDGADVFGVLRDSFELARGRSVSGRVVLTATLTANKASWKSDEDAAADAAELASASDAAVDVSTPS
jgi:uncharacterized protein YqgV (UPF0045/DUF77 family)